jgi:hypothetical protein
MICQRRQTERRGRKEVKSEKKGDVVYLDGIGRTDANSGKVNKMNEWNE